MTRPLQEVLAERKKAREMATPDEDWEIDGENILISESHGFRIAQSVHHLNADHIVTEHNTGAQVDEALERAVEVLRFYGNGKMARALLRDLGYKEENP